MKPQDESIAIKVRLNQIEESHGRAVREELFGRADALALGTGLSLLNSIELVIQLHEEFPGEVHAILTEMDTKAERLANFKDKDPTTGDYLTQLMGIVMQRRGQSEGPVVTKDPWTP